MSRQLKISLWGLYKINRNLFENFHLPTQIDKDNLTKKLMMETMDLDTIYSDPAVMQEMIDIWSASRLPIWQKIADVLEEEYDPIDNYDRYVDRTDTRDLNKDTTRTDDLTSDSTRTDNLANSNTETVSKVPFSDSTLSVVESTVDNGTNTGTQNVKTDNTGTQNVNTDDTGTIKREEHIHGLANAVLNATTRSALVEAEIKMRVENDLDCLIVGEFKTEFINLIY